MFQEANLQPTLKAPHLTHPSRWIFESAVNKQDISFEYLARLDAFITHMREKNIPSEVLATTVAQHRAELLPIVEHAKNHGTSRLQSLYRLITAYDTLEEMVLTPKVFTDKHSTREERSQTTQHLAGVHAQMIERLLDEQQHATHTQDRNDYTGIISEQTFLAAINLAYDSDIAALQSLAHEDQRMLTDCLVYLRDPDHSYEIPVQVKTSPYDLPESTDVLYVAMAKYNPAQCLSRGIVQYMNGGELGEDAQLHLNKLLDFLYREGIPASRTIHTF